MLKNIIMTMEYEERDSDTDIDDEVDDCLRALEAISDLDTGSEGDIDEHIKSSPHVAVFSREESSNSSISSDASTYEHHSPIETDFSVKIDSKDIEPAKHLNQCSNSTGLVNLNSDSSVSEISLKNLIAKKCRNLKGSRYPPFSDAKSYNVKATENDSSFSELKQPLSSTSYKDLKSSLEQLEVERKIKQESVLSPCENVIVPFLGTPEDNKIAVTLNSVIPSCSKEVSTTPPPNRELEEKVSLNLDNSVQPEEPHSKCDRKNVTVDAKSISGLAVKGNCGNKISNDEEKEEKTFNTTNRKVDGSNQKALLVNNSPDHDNSSATSRCFTPIKITWKKQRKRILEDVSNTFQENMLEKISCKSEEALNQETNSTPEENESLLTPRKRSSSLSSCDTVIFGQQEAKEVTEKLCQNLVGSLEKSPRSCHTAEKDDRFESLSPISLDPTVLCEDLTDSDTKQVDSGTDTWKREKKKKKKKRKRRHSKKEKRSIQCSSPVPSDISSVASRGSHPIKSAVVCKRSADTFSTPEQSSLSLSPPESPVHQLLEDCQRFSHHRLSPTRTPSPTPSPVTSRRYAPKKFSPVFYHRTVRRFSSASSRSPTPVHIYRPHHRKSLKLRSSRSRSRTRSPKWRRHHHRHRRSPSPRRRRSRTPLERERHVYKSVYRSPRSPKKYSTHSSKSYRHSRSPTIRRGPVKNYTKIFTSPKKYARSSTKSPSPKRIPVVCSMSSRLPASKIKILTSSSPDKNKPATERVTSSPTHNLDTENHNQEPMDISPIPETKLLNRDSPKMPVKTKFEPPVTSESGIKHPSASVSSQGVTVLPPVKHFPATVHPFRCLPPTSHPPPGVIPLQMRPPYNQPLPPGSNVLPVDFQINRPPPPFSQQLQNTYHPYQQNMSFPPPSGEGVYQNRPPPFVTHNYQQTFTQQQLPYSQLPQSAVGGIAFGPPSEATNRISQRPHLKNDNIITVPLVNAPVNQTSSYLGFQTCSVTPQPPQGNQSLSYSSHSSVTYVHKPPPQNIHNLPPQNIHNHPPQMLNTNQNLHSSVQPQVQQIISHQNLEYQQMERNNSTSENSSGVQNRFPQKDNHSTVVAKTLSTSCYSHTKKSSPVYQTVSSIPIPVNPPLPPAEGPVEKPPLPSSPPPPAATPLPNTIRPPFTVSPSTPVTIATQLSSPPDAAAPAAAASPPAPATGTLAGASETSTTPMVEAAAEAAVATPPAMGAPPVAASPNPPAVPPTLLPVAAPTPPPMVKPPAVAAPSTAPPPPPPPPPSSSSSSSSSSSTSSPPPPPPAAAAASPPPPPPAAATSPPPPPPPPSAAAVASPPVAAAEAVASPPLAEAVASPPPLAAAAEAVASPPLAAAAVAPPPAAAIATAPPPSSPPPPAAAAAPPPAAAAAPPPAVAAAPPPAAAAAPPKAAAAPPPAAAVGVAAPPPAAAVGVAAPPPPPAMAAAALPPAVNAPPPSAAAAPPAVVAPPPAAAIPPPAAAAVASLSSAAALPQQAASLPSKLNESRCNSVLQSPVFRSQRPSALISRLHANLKNLLPVKSLKTSEGNFSECNPHFAPSLALNSLVTATTTSQTISPSSLSISTVTSSACHTTVSTKCGSASSLLQVENSSAKSDLFNITEKEKEDSVKVVEISHPLKTCLNTPSHCSMSNKTSSVKENNINQCAASTGDGVKDSKNPTQPITTSAESSKSIPTDRSSNNCASLIDQPSEIGNNDSQNNSETCQRKHREKIAMKLKPSSNLNKANCQSKDMSSTVMNSARKPVPLQIHRQKNNLVTAIVKPQVHRLMQNYIPNKCGPNMAQQHSISALQVNENRDVHYDCSEKSDELDKESRVVSRQLLLSESSSKTLSTKVVMRDGTYNLKSTRSRSDIIKDASHSLDCITKEQDSSYDGDDDKQIPTQNKKFSFEDETVDNDALEKNEYLQSNAAIFTENKSGFRTVVPESDVYRGTKLETTSKNLQKTELLSDKSEEKSSDFMLNVSGSTPVNDNKMSISVTDGLETENKYETNCYAMVLKSTESTSDFCHFTARQNDTVISSDVGSRVNYIVTASVVKELKLNEKSKQQELTVERGNPEVFGSITDAELSDSQFIQSKNVIASCQQTTECLTESRKLQLSASDQKMFSSEIHNPEDSEISERLNTGILENIQTTEVTASQSKINDRGDADKIRLPKGLISKKQCEVNIAEVKTVAESSEIKKLLNKKSECSVHKQLIDLCRSDFSEEDVVEVSQVIDLFSTDDENDDIQILPIPPKVLPLVDITGDDPVISQKNKETVENTVDSVQISGTKTITCISGSKHNSSALEDNTHHSECEVIDCCISDSFIDKVSSSEEETCVGESSKNNIDKGENIKKWSEADIQTEHLSEQLAATNNCHFDQGINSDLILIGGHDPVRNLILVDKHPSKKSSVQATNAAYCINDIDFVEIMLSQLKPAPRSVKLRLIEAKIQPERMPLASFGDKLKSMSSKIEQRLKGNINKSAGNIIVEQDGSCSKLVVKTFESSRKRKCENDTEPYLKRRLVDKDLVTKCSSSIRRLPARTRNKTADGHIKTTYSSVEQVSVSEVCSDESSNKKNITRKKILKFSVENLQCVNIPPSESRGGTISTSVRRHVMHTLGSPRKNGVTFAVNLGGSPCRSSDNESDEQISDVVGNNRLASPSKEIASEKMFRSKLPSFALSTKLLLTKLRRHPLILQGSLKKMARLLRQDPKLAKIPVVEMTRIIQRCEQRETHLKIDCNCCHSKVPSESIAVQTDLVDGEIIATFSRAVMF